MQKIALVLACFTYESCGWRVQSPSHRVQRSHNGVDALAVLLQSLNPEAAFGPSSGLVAHRAHHMHPAVSVHPRLFGHRMLVTHMRDDRSQSAQEIEEAQSLQLSRRAALGLTALLPALPAIAFFESKEQLAVQSVATTKLKFEEVLKYVRDMARTRGKGVKSDPNDDAYIFRFNDFIIKPVIEDMKTAAPVLKSARALELPGELETIYQAIKEAARAKAADQEEAALLLADKVLGEYLQLADAQKFDVRQVSDINAYEGLSGVLYNKFLFRAGSKSTNAPPEAGMSR